MKKVIDFCKQRYKVLIPIMVVFVLLITMYFLYREYKYDNYRNKQDTLVYQCFGGKKIEYTAIVTYNLNDVIVDIKARDKTIEYDSTPIYYQENDKVIFPEEMSIVFPVKEGSQYKIYKNAVYENIENKHYIKNNTNRAEYSYFFLFDGKGLFYFPDAVMLKINGKEHTKLSGMSYVKIIGGNSMEYYDKDKDKTEVIEIEGKKVSVSSDEINVNLSERYTESFGKKILLMSPYNLNSLNN